ncbi:MAG: hypothetical protein WHS38_00610 [Thermodesulforhabdaceae bacterium]|jgi:hypothetical protein
MKTKISWVVENEGVGIKVEIPEGKEFLIAGFFNDMAIFQNEVDRLCKEIRHAFEKASEEWLALQKKSVVEKQSQDPQAFWAMLEKEPKENMIRLFNAQSEDIRKRVAQHVFEHVSVFSGAGAIFAELYNQETFLLEP